MAREDVDPVINACVAGREGELIFAYVYETAKKQKPVQRLWLSSMTPRRSPTPSAAPPRRGDGARSRRRPARAPRPTGWWA